MFKFIIGLFSKKYKNMFTKQELDAIENKLNNIRNEVIKKSNKSNDKIFSQSCKSIERAINMSLENLDDMHKALIEEKSASKNLENNDF